MTSAGTLSPDWGGSIRNGNPVCFITIPAPIMKITMSLTYVSQPGLFTHDPPSRSIPQWSGRVMRLCGNAVPQHVAYGLLHVCPRQGSFGKPGQHGSGQARHQRLGKRGLVHIITRYEHLHETAERGQGRLHSVSAQRGPARMDGGKLEDGCRLYLAAGGAVWLEQLGSGRRGQLDLLVCECHFGHLFLLRFKFCLGRSGDAVRGGDLLRVARGCAAPVAEAEVRVLVVRVAAVVVALLPSGAATPDLAVVDDVLEALLLAAAAALQDDV